MNLSHRKPLRTIETRQAVFVRRMSSKHVPAAWKSFSNGALKVFIQWMLVR